MKTRLVIAGACGRMGKQLIIAAGETADVVGAIECEGHPDIGRDAGECAGLPVLGCAVSSDIDAISFEDAVLVEFSQAHATVRNVAAAAKNGARAVVGTTGFTPEQLAQLEGLSRETAVVLAPNMSIGMNLMFKLTQEAAKRLGADYDVEIVEAHHRFKKDAPSGSAKRLAEMAASGLGRDPAEVSTYGRHGMVGERKPDEIGLHAVRAGDIVGDHIVMFGGMGERIELRHQAHSRGAFARGAIRAALWVAGKPAGLYDMQDVLGLR